MEFERDGDSLVLRKLSDDAATRARIAERLQGRGDIAMTTDEIMALTRADV